LETPTAPLSIRRVPLDSLRLDPANARQHPERNLESIRSSLQRFHQAEPLVVQKGTGRVIGGNGRLVAMRSLGWSECDVVEVDVDDLTATALGIALNRTSDLAEWDLSALGWLLESLREEDALEGVGFDESEIAELLASLDAELGDVLGVEENGAPEPPDEVTSRRGDLWIPWAATACCAATARPSRRSSAPRPVGVGVLLLLLHPLFLGRAPAQGVRDRRPHLSELWLAAAAHRLDHRSPLLRKILRHLGLPAELPALAPPRSPPQMAFGY